MSASCAPSSSVVIQPICDGSALAAATIADGLSAAFMIPLNGSTDVLGSTVWQTWQYVLYSALPAAAFCARAGTRSSAAPRAGARARITP